MSHNVVNMIDWRIHLTLLRPQPFQNRWNWSATWRNRGNSWVNSLGLYTTQWSWEGYSTRSTKQLYNPLTTAAVSKPLELIGSPTYVLACQEPTAPDSDINQTAGSPGRPSMWKNRCMHAAVCLLHAGQLDRAGDVAKSGNSWVNSLGSYTTQWSWEGYNYREYYNLIFAVFVICEVRPLQQMI